MDINVQLDNDHGNRKLLLIYDKNNRQNTYISLYSHRIKDILYINIKTYGDQTRIGLRLLENKTVQRASQINKQLQHGFVYAIFFAVFMLNACFAKASPKNLSNPECITHITKENTQHIYNALMAMKGMDCTFNGIHAQTDRVVISWKDAVNNKIETVVQLCQCDSSKKDKVDSPVTVENVSQLENRCPKTAQLLYQVFENLTFGDLLQPTVSPRQKQSALFNVDLNFYNSTTVNQHIRSQQNAATIKQFINAAIRLRILPNFTISLCLLVFISIYVRFFYKENRPFNPHHRSAESAQHNYFPPFQLVCLTLLLTSIATLFFQAVPYYLDTASFSSIDIFWIKNGIFNNSILSHRVLVSWESAFIQHLIGLNPALWFLVMLGLHLVSGILIYALGRTLNLSKSWSLCAAGLFIANPNMLESMYNEFLSDIVLLHCYLLVCISFFKRRETKIPRQQYKWFAVEAMATLAGVLNKESFVVYFLILVAIEVLYFLPLIHQKDGVVNQFKSVFSKLQTSLIIFVVACSVGIPYILSGTVHHFDISIHPLHLIQRLGLLLGTAALPCFRYVYLFGLWIFVTSAACFFFKKEIRKQLGIALVFTLAVSTPMLPLVDRLFPGYIYAPWAGAAILVAIIASTIKHIYTQICFVLLLFISLTCTPTLTRNDELVIDRGTARELTTSFEPLCDAAIPVVDISTPKWTAIQNNMCKKSNTCASNDTLQLANDFFKISCKSLTATIKIRK